MKSLREFINERTKERVLNAINSYTPAPTIFYESLEDYIFNYLHYDNIDYDNELNYLYEERLNFIENLKKYRRSEVTEQYKQLINESIKSYSIGQFLHALYKGFPELDDECVFYEIIDDNTSKKESGAFKIQIDWGDKYHGNKKLKTFLSDNLDEILKLCKFYRYYISKQSYDFRGLGFGFILFEPLDTKEVTNEIKNKFDGKIYHLTSKEFVESIKKNGLKIASPALKSDYNNPQYFMSLKELSKNSNDVRDEDEKIDDSTIRGKIRLSRRYRNFTDRTFLFYSNINVQEAGKYVAKKLNRKIEYSILIEINLIGHKNPIFKDTVMTDTEDIHFAYSNIDIPAKLISKIIEL